MAMSDTIQTSVRSVDGKIEIEFERTTEWNAPVTIKLGGETIEVHPGPLAEAVRLVNLEGLPT
jgi:hypothetical protein